MDEITTFVAQLHYTIWGNNVFVIRKQVQKMKSKWSTSSCQQKAWKTFSWAGWQHVGIYIYIERERVHHKSGGKRNRGEVNENKINELSSTLTNFVSSSFFLMKLGECKVHPGLWLLWVDIWNFLVGNLLILGCLKRISNFEIHRAIWLKTSSF